MPRDEFFGAKDDLVSPVSSGAAVTPSDATDLVYTSRGIYVGTGGNLMVTMMSGVDVLFTAVPGGTLLPIRVNRVKATGTTATNIVAVW